MNETNKKRLKVTASATLAVALLISGSLAWRDVSQHKTNKFQTKSVSESMVLVNEFKDKTEWESGESHPNVVYVRNGQDTDNKTKYIYTDGYVRIQLREFLGKQKSKVLWSEYRYLLDASGNHIKDKDPDVALTKAQAIWPTVTADSVVQVSTPMDGEDAAKPGNGGWEVAQSTGEREGEREGGYYYVRTDETSPNGIYGKFIMINNTPGELVSYLDESKTIDMDLLDKDQGNASVGQTSNTKGHNNANALVGNEEDKNDFYTTRSWKTDSKIEEVIKLELGSSVQKYSTWDGTEGKFWIQDDTNDEGWVYWAEKLNHNIVGSIADNSMTENFINAVELKDTEDQLVYRMHINMDAVSINDMSNWGKLPEKLANALGQPDAKTVLESVISNAEAKDEADYSPASWADLQTAIKNAKDVLADENSTQEQVDAQVTALNKAINALEKVASKTALQSAISDAESKVQIDYTTESWTALQTAISKAKAVLNNADSTQDQVDTEVTALNSAVSALVVKPAEKTSLQSAITDAEGKIESDYTPESWAQFKTELSNAKAIANNPNATQSEVNAQLAALNSAIDALEIKTVGKGALESAITAAESKVESDHTSESWTALQTALTNAKAVANNPNATQSEIDAQVSALNSAVAALVVKPAEKTSLRSAITAAEAQVQSDYTPESWAQFQTALTNAKAVANNQNAIQSEVDAQLEALNSAVSALVVKPAVKTSLQSAITAAEAKVQSDYTPESWAQFQTALTNAKVVANNPNATQSEVDAQLEALNSAIDALEIKTVDKTALQAAITDAETKAQIDYTTESWTEFQAALKNAKAVENKANALQTEIDAQVTALNSAVSALQTKPADLSALQTAISLAELKVEVDYTPESWTSFQTVLTNSKEIANNTQATQSEVNYQVSALNTAISSLIQLTGDKTELAASLNEAAALNKSEYTEKSWKLFETAHERASTIFEKVDVLQSQIDESVLALNDSINKLIRVYVVGDELTKFDINWQVLVADEGKYLIMVKDNLTRENFETMGVTSDSMGNRINFKDNDSNYANGYSDSKLLEYDTKFYDTFIKGNQEERIVQKVKWNSEVPDYSGSDGWKKINDGPTLIADDGERKAFTLSISDINFYDISKGLESSGGSWLRSPARSEDRAANLGPRGVIYDTPVNNPNCLRPAIWIQIEE